MHQILKSTMFLLVLLNPFMVIVYLVDVLERLSYNKFRRVLLRAGLISSLVFWLFAVVGDVIFSDLINAQFASFQIFGGVVFLLIGLQFIFQGKTAIQSLRGESEHIAGAIAMPILIGPGTLSFSVIIGKRLNSLEAGLAIFLAVFFSVLIMILFKKLYDNMQNKRDNLVQRYFEIAGRVTAFIAGTVAVEMIMQGLKFWIDKIGVS